MPTKPAIVLLGGILLAATLWHAAMPTVEPQMSGSPQTIQPLPVRHNITLALDESGLRVIADHSEDGAVRPAWRDPEFVSEAQARPPETAFDKAVALIDVGDSASLAEAQRIPSTALPRSASRTLTPKWNQRLAAFDVYIWDQCFTMEQSLRLD
jgi:hypothetical protein